MFASVCHPVPLPAFLASVHVLGRTCARLFLSEQIESALHVWFNLLANMLTLKCAYTHRPCPGRVLGYNGVVRRCARSLSLTPI